MAAPRAFWVLFCPGAKGKRHNRNSVPTLEYFTFKERQWQSTSSFGRESLDVSDGPFLSRAKERGKDRPKSPHWLSYSPLPPARAPINTRIRTISAETRAGEKHSSPVIGAESCQLTSNSYGAHCRSPRKNILLCNTIWDFFNKTILSNRYPLQWMKNIQALRGLYVEQHLHIRKAAFTVWVPLS